MSVMVTKFDKKTYYKNEIAPLVEKLLEKCHVADLPCFLSFCCQNDENGSKYISEGHLPPSNKITLSEDRFSEHLLVNLGFKVERNQTSNMTIMYDVEEDADKMDEYIDGDDETDMEF